jgi:hypothetical protein
MSASAPRGLVLLLVLAALLLLGSAVAYVLQQQRTSVASQAAPLAALYALALDADAAAAGDAEALTRFQANDKKLEDTVARDSGAAFANDGRFTRLMNNAAAVVRARGPLADAGSAAHDTLTLVPKLQTEADALAQALPQPNPPAVASALERFQARAQRLQIDLVALTQGTTDPSAAAQRIAESADYLGQVITGFAGGSSTLALPRVTAPEAARHLKALDGAYSELSAVVRRAVTAAPALPAAQSAAHAIPQDVRDLGAAAAGAPSPSSSAAGIATWLPLVLMVAGLGLLLAALLAALRMYRTVERQRVSADAQRQESDGERPQPAGDPAPPR